MPTIQVAESFEFSEDTLSVTTFPPGQHEVSELCAEYAQAHGFLVGEVPADEPPVDESPVDEAPVEAPKPKGKK